MQAPTPAQSGELSLQLISFLLPPFARIITTNNFIEPTNSFYMLIAMNTVEIH